MTEEQPKGKDVEIVGKLIEALEIGSKYEEAMKKVVQFYDDLKEALENIFTEDHQRIYNIIKEKEYAFSKVLDFIERYSAELYAEKMAKGQGFFSVIPSEELDNRTAKHVIIEIVGDLIEDAIDEIMEEYRGYLSKVYEDLKAYETLEKAKKDGETR